MSTAHGTLDLATAAFQHAQPPLAAIGGLRLKDLPYVGVHRRHDGQGLDADGLRPQSGHRPRHRRLLTSAS
jgi:hypothetical protein